MNAEFITHEIWQRLTQAVRNSSHRCAIAVAYFGAGGNRMLPLQRGSRLVVDASERAVTSGQTCPAELLKLVKRGVAVYSVPNLHAKVFVLGRAAYIGSANVSGRSATQLVEAVVRTTERSSVRDARKFVLDLCLHEMTPALLRRLAKLYRPPLVPGGKRRKKSNAGGSWRPAVPRLLLVQLNLKDWPERDQVLHDDAMSEAKKRRQHPRSHKIESFRWTGPCPHRMGDVVIQVTNEGRGKVLVAPPGNVLNIRTRKEKNRRVSFVCLEIPNRRERNVKAIAHTLGHGSLKKLRRNGQVKNANFARALLKTWSK